jgi:hypothetical protein
MRIYANHNTTAAGMLAFQLHGRRDDPRVLRAGDWIAEQPIPLQKSIPRFYYGCYVWSQAMAHLGGKHWNSFFPRLADRLLAHQDVDGHWRLDQSFGSGVEDQLGTGYYTSLAVLCLTLPDQLLPVHQR